MDGGKVRDIYVGLVKRYFVPGIFGFVGLIFFGWGLISFFVPSSGKEDILFDGVSDVAVDVKSDISPTIGKQVVVDVEGAVARPGVYHLLGDSRVQDGLVAAGGLSVKADREKVEKVLNLAAKVVDGAKVYVPFAGEMVASGGEAVLGESSSVININSAGEAELDNLPGVGSSTVQKLVGNRPYGSVDDLVSKKVVTRKMFEKIKDMISVY
jgi:competence protein ComEA